MVDEQNFFHLSHGVFQPPSDKQPRESYVDFSLCLNGDTRDHGSITERRPVPPDNPLYLSLERRGQKLIATLSTDGNKWEPLATTDIPADWPGTLQIGVLAVSTSTREFSPQFSK